MRRARRTRHATGARELCIVVVSGIVTVQAASSRGRELGERASPFEDVAPHAVYLPPGRDVTITADTAAEIALCTAPARQGVAAAPDRARDDAPHACAAQGTNTRYVRDILPQDEPAEALLVVEVHHAAGPLVELSAAQARHRCAAAESSLEETYYHRLDPPQGFAFQRVYTDDRSLDEAMTVEDRDVVMVPRGYHPVIVPHGYTSYYLNVMAGPQRVWHFHNDPAHEWMLRKPG